MRSQWRAWVLSALFAGPYLIALGLGFLYIYQRGWLLYSFVVFLTTGIASGYLINRWTHRSRKLLPPLDWDAPDTFSEEDKSAWKLVQAEAERADTGPPEALSGTDIYVDTGKSLAAKLARHYHPDAEDPIEHVPVVEILTALELAAEDLANLCRQVPGGDLVTYAHWKRAVKAAGYYSKASEIYNFLLPVFSPATGLIRLGAQKLMVQPQWRNMQQNVLKWFFTAYVNRLGTHLIELYSQRLVIGADAYRKLTRRRGGKVVSGHEGPGALSVAVAGSRHVGKSGLIAALTVACAGDLVAVKARLVAGGFDGSLAELLKTAQWREVAGYTVHHSGESARDRATRREAVEEAAEADLLLLVVGPDMKADAAFVRAWTAWFAANPGLHVPPALAVAPASARDAAREALPAAIAEVVPVELVGPGGDPELSRGVTSMLLPALAPLLHRAEQAAMIRYLHKFSARSKARRLANQVGRQGRRLWEGVRAGKDGEKAGVG